MTETFAFYLSTFVLPWCGGEGGHSKSRAETARAPTEGASPLVCSPRRGHIPRDPPCSNPTLGAFMLSHTLTPYASRLYMAERVGFEPTVPLLGRMLSKHVDSTTLAPLRTDFREAAS